MLLVYAVASSLFLLWWTTPAARENAALMMAFGFLALSSVIDQFELYGLLGAAAREEEEADGDTV